MEGDAAGDMSADMVSVIAGDVVSVSVILSIRLCVVSLCPCVAARLLWLISKARKESGACGGLI